MSNREWGAFVYLLESEGAFVHYIDSEVAFV